MVNLVPIKVVHENQQATDFVTTPLHTAVHSDISEKKRHQVKKQLVY